MELAIIAVGVIAALALHFWFTRQRAAWLGWIVPALWVAGLSVLFLRGEIDRPTDYLMCLVGSLFLGRTYVEGRRIAGAGRTTRTA